MAQFQYRATDYTGKIVEGSMEAGEERSVVARLQERGLIPLRIGAGGAVAAPARVPISLPTIGGRKKVRNKDVLVFTQELSTLLKAGLPLDKSLTTLADLAPGDLKRIATEVLNSVRGGSSLAEALGQHPKAFSPLYVNMVKAGEVGGVLDEVLARLQEYLRNVQELRDEVRSAMTYPILLSGVGAISIAVLLIFVLPKFATMFADLGQALPLSTRMMLGISDAFTNIWTLPIFIAVVGSLIGLFRYVSTGKRRYGFDAFKLRMPLFGSLQRRMEVARFGRTLGTLLHSGVPMLQALDIVREVASNQVIARTVSEVQVGVREGAGVAAPLGKNGNFPALALQMIAVGEDTGKLDEMLISTADYFDREVRNEVQRLTSLLEPMMILVMGVVVGFMVISMLMAVFSINDINM
ncbi:MAG TPA: type II secretion system F family protein [Candidatus Binatia bacterium]|jgi:general secretion pathway protein F